MKVLCKRNYIVGNEDMNYYKNHQYEVFYEYDDCYWLHSLAPSMVNKFVKISSFNGQLAPIFEDYFITLKELRKLKINKLNEL